jgi:hypothetical protein
MYLETQWSLKLLPNTMPNIPLTTVLYSYEVHQLVRDGHGTPHDKDLKLYHRGVVYKWEQNCVLYDYTQSHQTYLKITNKDYTFKYHPKDALNDDLEFKDVENHRKSPLMILNEEIIFPNPHPNHNKG